MVNGAASFICNFAFFAREKVNDGMGNTRGKWVPKFTTKAAITFRQGSETVQAARLEGKQPAFLTIRSFHAAKEITTEWCCCDARETTFDAAKGKFGGRVYNIRAINRDPISRQYYRLTIESGVAV